MKALCGIKVGLIYWQANKAFRFGVEQMSRHLIAANRAHLNAWPFSSGKTMTALPAIAYRHLIHSSGSGTKGGEKMNDFVCSTAKLPLEADDR
jgi:hypothetical protein